jgi:hypothetical protein
MKIPRQKIEVFDAYAESKGAGPVKVAEVVVDGGKGSLVVLDPKLAPALRDVFERTTRMAGGAPDARGLGADVPVAVRPYSAESLAHAMKHGLPAHNLRAVVIALDRKR